MTAWARVVLDDHGGGQACGVAAGLRRAAEGDAGEPGDLLVLGRQGRLTGRGRGFADCRWDPLDVQGHTGDKSIFNTDKLMKRKFTFDNDSMSAPGKGERFRCS